MKGKIVPLIVVSIMMLLLAPSSISQSQQPEDAFITNLIADGGGDGMKYDAGDISVWITNGTIFVQFSTDEDWLLKETHLHIDSSGILDDGFDDIPINKPGSPKIGRFELKSEHNPAVKEHIYSEFVGEVEAGHSFIIAAQAVVISETKGVESSWCEGIRFREKGSWAMYFVFIDYEELTAELAMDVFISREPYNFPLWGIASGGVEPYNYSWDLDNDGVFNDAYGDTILIDGTSFWLPDSYNAIGFKVQDSSGQVAYDTAIAYLPDFT